MDGEASQQLTLTAERLASAAETLDRVLAKLDAQQEALNAKVDRIVAAVEERLAESQEETRAEEPAGREMRERIVELEKANTDLKAQTARLARKTLPPLVTALLSKTSSEVVEKLDPSVLEQTLQTLTVEQRIAVKAEMARAGMIE